MALLFGKLPRIIARVQRDARQEIFLNTLLFPKTFDKSLIALEQRRFDLKEMAFHTYKNKDLASWKADDIRCILTQKGDRTWKITLFSVGILFGGFVGLITSF